MSKRTFEAWRGDSIFEAGLGHVMVCRRNPSGDTEAGVFLVDMYCLGVKSAFYMEFPAAALSETLDRVFEQEGRESLSPACARKLIEDALAYARSLGFSPHPDYKKAARVLGGIDARECNTAFTFGHGGKPLYVSGPHDSPHFQHLVLSTLRSRFGP